MISYVLLLGMVLTLSVIVASWIYFQAKNPPMAEQDVCDGVSISADITTCSSKVTATLTNSGRFTIHAVSVRYDTEDRDVLRYQLNPPVKNLDNFLPGKEQEYTGTGTGSIMKVKFIPIVNGTYCPEQTTYTC